jgi:hypothetical protein
MPTFKQFYFVLQHCLNKILHKLKNTGAVIYNRCFKNVKFKYLKRG